jgi:hypothetical protein
MSKDNSPTMITDHSYKPLKPHMKKMDGQYNTKTDLREMGCENVNWTERIQDHVYL